MRLDMRHVGVSMTRDAGSIVAGYPHYYDYEDGVESSNG